MWGGPRSGRRMMSCCCKNLYGANRERTGFARGVRTGFWRGKRYFRRNRAGEKPVFVEIFVDFAFWTVMLSVNRTGFPSDLLSPSSRRAWVEMLKKQLADIQPVVALLAEGVGRNCYTMGTLHR